MLQMAIKLNSGHFCPDFLKVGVRGMKNNKILYNMSFETFSHWKESDGRGWRCEWMLSHRTVEVYIVPLFPWRWFQGFNWEGLRRRKLTSPLRREVKHRFNNFTYVTLCEKRKPVFLHLWYSPHFYSWKGLWITVISTCFRLSLKNLRMNSLAGIKTSEYELFLRRSCFLKEDLM